MCGIVNLHIWLPVAKLQVVVNNVELLLRKFVTVNRGYMVLVPYYILHNIALLFTDSRIRMRLDIEARYNIRCSELQDSAVRSLLLSLAANMEPAVNGICAGGECAEQLIRLISKTYFLYRCLFTLILILKLHQCTETRFNLIFSSNIESSAPYFMAHCGTQIHNLK